MAKNKTTCLDIHSACGGQHRDKVTGWTIVKKKLLFTSSLRGLCIIRCRLQFTDIILARLHCRLRNKHMQKKWGNFTYSYSQITMDSRCDAVTLIEVKNLRETATRTLFILKTTKFMFISHCRDETG